MQLQKKTETPAKEELEALKAKFEAAKSKVIPATEIKTKIVNLRILSSCGCGGSSTENIHIEVPEDYDEFSEMEVIDDEDFERIRDDGYTIYDDHFFGDPSDDVDREEW